MKIKTIKSILLLFTFVSSLMADEGMWTLNNLSKENLDKMKELGFSIPFDQLYSIEKASIKDAVIQFNGGCTGITVSNQGLIFTNHHCGYDAIQSESTLEHDYLKNGFVSYTLEEEIPIKNMYVSYLIKTEDVTDRVLSKVNNTMNESDRIQLIDSVRAIIVDSINKESDFIDGQVISYYNGNKYYLQVYENFRDIRMVFAPPSSVGKFGDETDNWMWPRHTGDFSVFRVYANKDNKPADYSADNIPYTPKYFVPVSLKGYKEGDYTMTIGYPGSTDRYLSSWGVKQRVEDKNKPRIEVRGVKQAIWKEAMLSNDEIRIKYASKYARSSNYWKNSIGMNRGIEQLNVIERKRELEQKVRNWLDQYPDKKAFYGEALDLLEKAYTSSDEIQRSMTYLSETFQRGAEIVRLASNVVDFNTSDTPEGQQHYIENVIFAPYKDYDPATDQKVLAAMLKLAKERVAPKYLPDVYKEIEKKYKNDYERYAADVFKKSAIPYPGKFVEMLKDKKKVDKLKEDPAFKLAMSYKMSYFDLIDDMAGYIYDIQKGERLFMACLTDMNSSTLSSDANFTMRMSYGSIGGYVPYDGAWYDYYTTTKGVFEKYKKDDPEFNVQPEILDLLRSKNFGDYGNHEGDMNLCFLSDNDITGGNSGSPVFDGNGRLIGLAFDGNWEAMSGDIVFEPELQKTISVDIRYVMFMIDRWGKCTRLLEELLIEK